MATHTIHWHEMSPQPCLHGVATIGNFDGVHRGHRALLLQIVLQGKALQAPSVVVTFDPHPLELLRPQMVPARLTSTEERAALLAAVGVDHVIVLKTTPDLLALTAAEFFEAVIVRGLQARALVEGENFFFGKDRGGTIGTLAQLCEQHALALTIVPCQELSDEEVSSSAVRRALVNGDVIQAAYLLGRPYRITGRVVTGAQRGRTLGFPTANLDGIATLLPRNGVYIAQACVAGRPWMAAVNIGPNPTFGEQARKVEAHLLDFTGDLYGAALSLDFIDRLRDTRAFASVTDLLAQLQHDVAAIRELTREGAAS